MLSPRVHEKEPPGIYLTQDGVVKRKCERCESEIACPSRLLDLMKHSILQGTA